MNVVIYYRNIEEDPSTVTSVIVPSNVTSIDREAFRGYTSLTSIILPPNLATLGDGAFYGCTSLETINLPPSLTKLGNCVFYGCTSLSTITLPTTVRTLGIWPFNGCESLTYINQPLPPNINQYPNTRGLFVEAIRKIKTENMKLWTRTHNENSRSPLMIAAAMSLKWRNIKYIFNAYKPAIYEYDDKMTGLPVFMLAAVGPNSDIESVYRLCKEHPSALMHSFSSSKAILSSVPSVDANEARHPQVNHKIVTPSTSKRHQNTFGISDEVRIIGNGDFSVWSELQVSGNHKVRLEIEYDHGKVQLQSSLDDSTYIMYNINNTSYDKRGKKRKKDMNYGTSLSTDDGTSSHRTNRSFRNTSGTMDGRSLVHVFNYDSTI